MSDLIKRSDAIEAIHNYWKKRLDTLPTKESEYGEVYADIHQVDKILEHNKILCNFINAIPSADRPQGEWKRRLVDNGFNADWICSECGYRVKTDFVSFNFCPNCGCRMKGADDEF